jgi:Zn-dependent peptidase ImmA (M78 family)
VSLGEQLGWNSTDIALEHWRNAFIQAGVYTFKDAFHVDNYFGFCLYDDTYPVIYVNNSSAKSRQIFTLFHELAHLLFHTSGIDVTHHEQFGYMPGDSRRIEMLANAMAGVLLVPEPAFDEAMRGQSADRQTASTIADRFSVSREVIYRKMLDRRLVSAHEYEQAAAEWSRQARGGGEGGNYYYSQFAYLGRRYIDLVLQRHYERGFDDLQLADYLNIKPRSVAAFEEMYSRTR